MSIRVIGVIGLAPLLAAGAAAQPSTDQMNEANNPLTPKLTVNVQNYWAPRLYGTDAHTNTFLLRGVMPHKLFGAPQILRATLPVATVPEGPGMGNTTGVGDLNLFNVFLFKAEGMELGVGPQLTIPTASNDTSGTGKWRGRPGRHRHRAAEMGPVGRPGDLAAFVCR
jgi:hypothetical protein